MLFSLKTISQLRGKISVSRPQILPSSKISFPVYLWLRYILNWPQKLTCLPHLLCAHVHQVVHELFVVGAAIVYMKILEQKKSAKWHPLYQINLQIYINPEWRRCVSARNPTSSSTSKWHFHTKEKHCCWNISLPEILGCLESNSFDKLSHKPYSQR